MTNELGLDLRNRSTAVFIPEVFSQTGLDEALLTCREVGTPCLEVWVRAHEAETFRPLLERRNAAIGGTATRDSNLYVKFRIQVRVSELNGDIQMPSLHDERTLMPVVDNMKLSERYNSENVSRRVADIVAQHRTPDYELDVEHVNQLAAAALRTEHPRRDEHDCQ